MPRTGELNGFLDEGCLIEGTVTFRETLRVDGKIKGSIISEKDLIIGPTGSVEGDVKVGTLQVSGIVIGTVRTKEKIFVHRGGRLFADIETPAFIIEDGAIFQGKCKMESSKDAEITPIREQKGGK